MTPVTLPTDLPVLPFPDQAALEAWLEAEHATAPGLYVKLAKKGSGVPSINWEQMVEVLLCFGWIDGRANRLDDSFYLQRITPRRPKSVWSAKNVATVERLIAEGRMRPAGLAVVEAAKTRWTARTATPSSGGCTPRTPRRRAPSGSPPSCRCSPRAAASTSPRPPRAALARSGRRGSATRA
jgi:uncharacterized protein YdeI (YjbR/CyaY-like superfamily)